MDDDFAEMMYEDAANDAARDDFYDDLDDYAYGEVAGENGWYVP